MTGGAKGFDELRGAAARLAARAERDPDRGETELLRADDGRPRGEPSSSDREADCSCAICCLSMKTSPVSSAAVAVSTSFLAASWSSR